MCRTGGRRPGAQGPLQGAVLGGARRWVVGDGGRVLGDGGQ